MAKRLSIIRYSFRGDLIWVVWSRTIDWDCSTRSSRKEGVCEDVEGAHGAIVELSAIGVCGVIWVVAENIVEDVVEDVVDDKVVDLNFFA